MLLLRAAPSPAAEPDAPAAPSAVSPEPAAQPLVCALEEPGGEGGAPSPLAESTPSPDLLHAQPGANGEPALCGARGRGVYAPAFREAIARGDRPCPACLAALS